MMDRELGGVEASICYQDSPVNPSMGGSVATSLSLTVLVADTHPDSDKLCQQQH